RRLRVAGVAAAQQPALRQQLGPRRAMDCTVDAAAAEQARIRGVDDGVDALLRDVAADGLDHIGKLALTESESEHRTGACRAPRRAIWAWSCEMRSSSSSWQPRHSATASTASASAASPKTHGPHCPALSPAM